MTFWEAGAKAGKEAYDEWKKNVRGRGGLSAAAFYDL
jgi:hypothetical protein